MTSIEQLKAARESALSLTQHGAPQATSNQFFGVGPITDMALNEVDARQLRFEFDAWLEENYPKLDDKGALQRLKSVVVCTVVTLQIKS